MLSEFLPPENGVWGKVMFLHVSVILFTRSGVPASGPMFLLGGLPPRERDSASRGVCMREWGGLHSGGGGLQSVGWTDPPPRTRKAGGTHPTGRFSCLPCRKFKKVLSFTMADCLFSYFISSMSCRKIIMKLNQKIRVFSISDRVLQRSHTFEFFKAVHNTRMLILPTLFQ